MKYRIALITLALSCSLAWAEPKQTTGAVATVLQLYRDFAWTAVIEEPMERQAFKDLPRAVLAKYFSPELIGLLNRDRLCSANAKELSCLDFDPIWASQDPVAMQMKILPGATPDAVKVSYIYPSNGEEVSMNYRLVRKGGKWLIDDIRYSSDENLREILSKPR